MPDEIFLFFDFDDTLSDFSLHGPQYVSELARLLSSDFGGEAEEWSSVIKPTLAESIQRYTEKFANNPLGGYNAWIEAERVRVAQEIFAGVGKSLPPDENIAEFAKRVQFDALTCCNAIFPGTDEALHDLFDRGVRMQLASSQESDYLLAALVGGGIESYTESKFGPDLIDCAKEGPEFYRRIFEVCKIRPSQAIVIDDQAMCLDWAEETGARIIQAALRPDSPQPEFPVVLHKMSDLPNLI
jgi:phosphoglycolate phosphatase-like HAD superfamily hydrolase